MPAVSGGVDVLLSTMVCCVWTMSEQQWADWCGYRGLYCFVRTVSPSVCLKYHSSVGLWYLLTNIHAHSGSQDGYVAYLCCWCPVSFERFVISWSFCIITFSFSGDQHHRVAVFPFWALISVDQYYLFRCSFSIQIISLSFKKVKI